MVERLQIWRNTLLVDERHMTITYQVWDNCCQLTTAVDWQLLTTAVNWQLLTTDNCCQLTTTVYWQLPSADNYCRLTTAVNWHLDTQEHCFVFKIPQCKTVGLLYKFFISVLFKLWNVLVKASLLAFGCIVLHLLNESGRLWRFTWCCNNKTIYLNVNL